MSTIPLLSIGMIFKNEARCIERCLRSLEPLRQAIPCELIMADTGAEDDSREIAEKYADEVFDFEWIDDFAAARNAVMDRCSGKWYLTIDSDEWLDEDISELLAFLENPPKMDFAFVIQRNYGSAALEKSEVFSDFRALRLVRLATGQRYHGAIHESWFFRGEAERLTHTILHHDGYFFTDPKQHKKKMQRNMKLLRQTLQKAPESLRTLTQCIESGGSDADYVQYIRRAVDVVQKKHDEWETFGGIIMSHAVEAAYTREMPELDKWIEFSVKQFPNSIFVQVDLQSRAFAAAFDAKEWKKAIQYGESYLKGLRLLHTKKLSKKIESDLGLSSIQFGNPIIERTLSIALADSYLQNRQGEKALELLLTLPGEKFQPDHVRNAVVVLCHLHAQTNLDISPALTSFYRQISEKIPDEQTKQARLASFNATAAAAFTQKYQEKEKGHEDYWRPAYTAFLALADECEAGRAAKIITADSPDDMRTVLAQVEDWQALPIEALEHALQAGVAFPLKGKPLDREVLDGLAARMTHDDNPALQMALALPDKAEYLDWQSLYWAQALVLAALRTFDWKLGKKDTPVSAFACPEKKKKEEPDIRPKDTPEVGLALLRRFAQLESALLPLLYAPSMLTEDHMALLAPMHRWGLCCAAAFEALDGGESHAYLQLLRKALKACPGQKNMVQFLLDRFLEDARPKASPELLALAEKVRAILSAYDPNNPAVAAIRESDAYKQVAWLIETEPVGQMVQ